MRTLVALLVALTLVAGSGSPTRAQTVTWDPMARPVGEADTLFLPDLSSWQSVAAEGGFLWGHHDETSEKVKDKYAFGRGRFGPAIKPRPGDDWTPVNFATDPESGELLEAGKRFAAWLDASPGRCWAMMMNYHPGRPTQAATGHHPHGFSAESAGDHQIPCADRLRPRPPAARRSARRGRQCVSL